MFDVGSKLGLLILVFLQVLQLDRLNICNESPHIFRDSPSPRKFKTSRYEQTIPISIHIFAWKRRKSLERLCKSIEHARYHGHRIPLHFHVDGDPLESVVEFVENFKWRHGRKYVHLRDERLGMPAVPPASGSGQFDFIYVCRLLLSLGNHRLMLSLDFSWKTISLYLGPLLNGVFFASSSSELTVPDTGKTRA